MIRQVTENGNVLTVNVSDSTSIASMRYETDAQILTVAYKKGKGVKYEFPGVPKEKFDFLKNAPSLGKALAYLKREMGL